MTGAEPFGLLHGDAFDRDRLRAALDLGVLRQLAVGVAASKNAFIEAATPK